MAPNLICAKTAATPWTWHLSMKSKSKSKHDVERLYFAREPVPGIYATNAEDKTFLVALRSSKKRDDEGIFRKPTSNSAIRVRRLELLCDSKTREMNNHPAVMCRPNITRNDSGIGLDSFYEAEDSGEMIGIAPGVETSMLIVGDVSTSAQSSQSSGISLRIGDDATRNQQRDASTTTTLAAHRTIISPKCTVHPANDITKSSANSTPVHKLVTTTTKDRQGGIQPIDLPGYRCLGKPLQVQHCQFTKRQMFTAEMRARTLKMSLCKVLNCTARDLSACKETMQREMFALDDGESWIVIGERTESLYRVDKVTGGMRRTRVDEVEESLVRLEGMRVRFVGAGKEVYMPVLRYLGLA